MKRIYLSGLLVALALALTAQQNNPNTYNALSARVLAIDHEMPNETIGEASPTFALEVGIRRQFGKYFGLAAPVKLGTIDVGELENISVVGADLLPTFFPLGTEKKVTPYLHAGAGVMVEAFEDANHQIPLGLGFSVRLGSNSWFNLQGEYRMSNQDGRDNIMAGLGYVYRLTSTDTDGDGVINRDDKCPSLPGPAATNGCPDTDMDGVLDADDKCPATPGPANLQGCPDGDMDGVADPDDKCPQVAGLATLAGCPDTDGDGVADPDDECPDLAGTLNGCPDSDGDGVGDATDQCPNKAGPARLQGCPDGDADGVPDDIDQCPGEAGPLPTGCPDADGDGVPDKDDPCPNVNGRFEGCPDSDGDGVGDHLDRCPSQPGPAATSGCPEVREEVRQRLDYAARNVRFESGSAKLKEESYIILGEIAGILREYRDYNLVISGHTDNVGREDTNLVLSRKRASACRDYLTATGIKYDRISSAGYGQTLPIAPNNTSEGRRRNRRVEFELVVRE